MGETFGSETTTDQILDGRDLSGQSHVVTGASGGLGLETARSLASHGALVIMAARNAEKNAAAAQQILAAHPDAKLEQVELDLGDLASARAAASKIVAQHATLDSVIGNAGVMATPFAHTNDGFEQQFGVNHLGHFVFVNGLVPSLIAGAPSRIVLLSSAGHTMGKVNFEDPNYVNRPYEEFDAYGQSKTANILCAVGLDARLKDKGVRAYAVHPGAIHTELGRYFTKEVVDKLKSRIAASAEEGKSAADNDAGSKSDGGGMQWKSTEAGAATSVWAATHADLDGHGGIYVEDCGFSYPASADHPGGGVQDYAVNPENAQKLWILSEELVGETFTF